jgi:hypothetical protein
MINLRVYYILAVIATILVSNVRLLGFRGIISKLKHRVFN